MDNNFDNDEENTPSDELVALAFKKFLVKHRRHDIAAWFALDRFMTRIESAIEGDREVSEQEAISSLRSSTNDDIEKLVRIERRELERRQKEEAVRQIDELKSRGLS